MGKGRVPQPTADGAAGRVVGKQLQWGAVEGKQAALGAIPRWGMCSGTVKATWVLPEEILPVTVSGACWANWFERVWAVPQQ